MILILGRGDDPPVSLLLEALQQRKHPYCLLDPRALDRDGLQLQGGAAGRLCVAGQKLPLAQVRSVFARPLWPSGHWRDAAATQRASQAFQTLMEWLDVAPALVVNRPRSMQSNHSKPMQAQWIAQSGFAVPQTLITSSPDAARAFWQTHGRVIFKSISGVRSIVRELDASSAARLDLLRWLPVQFQAWVPGVDLRVHVVGERCFAAEVRSDAIDYRYARGAEQTRLQKYALPSEVAARCVRLARALGLPLAGIDLRRRPGGDYVCFEVNPMPAYSYYESHTGLPISTALAGLLAGAEATGSRDASH